MQPGDSSGRGDDGPRPGPDRQRGNRGGRGRQRPDGTRTSGGPREPAGIERAQQRADAPPRGMASTSGSSSRGSVGEPALAQDAPVDVPKGVRREIQRVTNDAETANRLLQHVTAAFSALDERDGRTALPHLRYLKARLPRTGLLREALGVALYLQEDYRDAMSELQAFRRLTGSNAQNHLVADCIRAVGEGEHRIPELIEEMEAAEEPAPDAARFEGRIVWASWLADQGDVGAGRAVLSPLLEEEPGEDVEEHHLRAWYVAGDLAERSGDDDRARSWFSRIAEVAEGFFDTEDRLDALS